jgi:hypothetical protein
MAERTGEPWTEEEDAVFQRMAHDGAGVPKIARALNRTQSAIRSRAGNKGIKVAPR